ncbi:MAG: hypothetical protein K0R17_865 [Rariglobus sp.]|jgi:hypothetical protein|nr:hypothetical protein [Rariglobus sp.]
MKIRPCSLGSGMDFVQAGALVRNFTDAQVFPEHTTSVALNVAGPIKQWRMEFLFGYAIFPPNIMRFDAEWTNAGRKMAVGDVIIQRTMMPPVGFGVCIEFAVRVCALFDDEKRLGFAYETLSGHPESGVSEFYFEEREGDVFFTIHTRSQPSHWTARFASCVFTLPYQAWCTRRAAAQVRTRFHQENAASIAAQAQKKPEA